MDSGYSATESALEKEMRRREVEDRDLQEEFEREVARIKKSKQEKIAIQDDANTKFKSEIEADQATSIQTLERTHQRELEELKKKQQVDIDAERDKYEQKLRDLGEKQDTLRRNLGRETKNEVEKLKSETKRRRDDLEVQRKSFDDHSAQLLLQAALGKVKDRISLGPAQLHKEPGNGSEISKDEAADQGEGNIRIKTELQDEAEEEVPIFTATSEVAHTLQDPKSSQLLSSPQLSSTTQDPPTHSTAQEQSFSRVSHLAREQSPFASQALHNKSSRIDQGGDYGSDFDRIPKSPPSTYGRIGSSRGHRSRSPNPHRDPWRPRDDMLNNGSDLRHDEPRGSYTYNNRQGRQSAHWDGYRGDHYNGQTYRSSNRDDGYNLSMRSQSSSRAIPHRHNGLNELNGRNGSPDSIPRNVASSPSGYRQDDSHQDSPHTRLDHGYQGIPRLDSGVHEDFDARKHKRHDRTPSPRKTPTPDDESRGVPQLNRRNPEQPSQKKQKTRRGQHEGNRNQEANFTNSALSRAEVSRMSTAIPDRHAENPNYIGIPTGPRRNFLHPASMYNEQMSGVIGLPVRAGQISRRLNTPNTGASINTDHGTRIQQTTRNIALSITNGSNGQQQYSAADTQDFEARTGTKFQNGAFPGHYKWTNPNIAARQNQVNSTRQHSYPRRDALAEESCSSPAAVPIAPPKVQPPTQFPVKCIKHIKDNGTLSVWPSSTDDLHKGAHYERGGDTFLCILKDANVKAPAAWAIVPMKVGTVLYWPEYGVMNIQNRPGEDSGPDLWLQLEEAKLVKDFAAAIKGVFSLSPMYIGEGDMDENDNPMDLIVAEVTDDIQVDLVLLADALTKT